MRKIKFRGVDLETGEYVYGEFGYGATSGEPVIYFYDSDAQQWVGASVEEDSVAQFVGYDQNGKEIYEGDELTNADGKIYIAHRETAYRSADLIIRNRNLTDGCALVLKEKKS